ncbi:Uncharacterized protein ALO57_02637 [Pseudomonas coronafaciens pv. oryzae]|nr:Uncharacterized protein ALO57_02637 [Pseudomonas coronafaciens pv. oryzae]QIQ72900.1 hypothetical protein HBB04_03300 [Pseudomonas coronafaciens]RMM80970.1 hypothetical protein ALQ71_02079 [Pseudomonas coronafaciens pv. striafaciens]RMP25630.1 hypothetical protein ALQ25_03821 [Pseudomonas coronafaciens pv. atropurpurea]RMV68426.1 hypothetical protein ALP06_02949 [Pseudomonas coronafaciens pv. atropurpurea]
MSLTVGRVRWGRSFYIYHWRAHRYCVAHDEALCAFDRVASYDLMRGLDVQVYHIARMAEVIGAEHARRFRGIYPYPNADMHQPDEKAQLNLFLGEWLSHCLACGHEFEAVR